ncbi:MAG: DUF2339 domain-containing protein [Candidatus Azobacteroides sp.]|nr:DUF2339 domain-containing protein [Candidatus Azobacteroides sp.]
MDEEILITLLFIAVLSIGAIVLSLVTLIRIGSVNEKIDRVGKMVAHLHKRLTEEFTQTGSNRNIKEQPVEEIQTKVPEISEKEPAVRKTVDVYESKVIGSPVPPSETKKEGRTVPEPVQSYRKPEHENVPEKTFIERVSENNLLSKIGIVTLVLGIGFFVKYAIDQNWINEVGRVAVGLLTGGIIIAVAHQLKSKYHVFSSILVGGGISVFYITITLAFRQYELFSQPVAFALLIAVTVFSVILSLLYDRKELAIFSLLGGFASPLMASTGTGNYIVLFSYLLILNAGMLIVSFRKNWKVVGIIGYVLTLFFFWSWLLTSFESQFIGATLFSVLFFVQFYLLALIDHFKSGKKITAYQAFLILTDNLSLFASCIYIFDDYVYDVKGIVTISIAVVNAVVMITLFRKSKVDRMLIYLIIAIVMSFVSLAVPIQLNGHVITMFWAAEAVLLLWLWQKSRIKVFRTGFLIVSILVIISYLMDAVRNYSGTGLPVVSNRIFITGVVVTISFLIHSFLLKKESSDDTGKISKDSLWPVETIRNVFKFVAIVFVFIVPFLELNYQLAVFTDNAGSVSSFRYVVTAAYTALFIAGLGVIYRKKIKSSPYVFGLLFTFVALYALIYNILVIELRYDVFFLQHYAPGYFLIHLLGLPAVVSVIFLLIKNVKFLSERQFSMFCRSMTILSVIILSIETDHIVLSLLGNKENYHSLLYDTHTFGYPILWGIIAMILMIWGLKQKEVLLRKISLVFFGVILLKFYAYDVWHMSQTGRIVSFVLLGIILLSVSFLQQKIKTLVKK